MDGQQESQGQVTKTVSEAKTGNENRPSVASRIICGDCMEVLPTLPASSVHCVVTSPPYFALRAYLPKDHPDKSKEIGSEPTPEAFIETMVRVFREVRRVMRPDGVLFLNLGDSYCAGGRVGHGTRVGYKQQTNVGTLESGDMRANDDTVVSGNLLNMPHRVAEALRAYGWIWRQTIVWAKRSPMPEAMSGWRWQRCKVKVVPGKVSRQMSSDMREVTYVPDYKDPENFAKWSECPGCEKCEPNGGYVLRRGSGRCTTAHEYVFVLAKSNRYFWDSEQSKEASLPASTKRTRSGFRVHERDAQNHYREGFQRGAGYELETRNPRSVWTLSSEPTKVAHFATFPSELVYRCLKAGVSGCGCCPECGSPWAPVVESERVATRPAHESKTYVDPEGSPYQMHHGTIIGNRDPERHCTQTKVNGYRSTCQCGHKDHVGCMVLDPFAGIGTTGQVALAMGHRFVGIELNPEYAEISRDRIYDTPRCLFRRQKGPRKPRAKRSPEQKELFAYA
jgi:DNA modification methylase